MTGEATFRIINEIPVIGPRFACRGDALATVRRVVEQVENLTGPVPAAVEFIREGVGPVTLQITLAGRVMARLAGLDELTCWRFKKTFKKRCLS